MESSSETCTCRHLPALHPVAFPTSFQSIFCWSFHRLQWQKRCSRVWAAVLPPPPHHQHLSSSRCPNRFRYVPTGAEFILFPDACNTIFRGARYTQLQALEVHAPKCTQTYTTLCINVHSSSFCQVDSTPSSRRTLLHNLKVRPLEHAK
jgi:hypothetical protein